MSVWDLSSLTEQERSIIQEALDRCDFPFELLLPELQSEVNRKAIPVEFDDLSRYRARARDLNDFEANAHNDGHGDSGHIDVKEGDDSAHGIMFREQVLGLAWYSGKVTIEKSLVNNPQLAQEVFLCEGAHMTDFFYLTEYHRRQILSYYGATNWFEEAGENDYEDWVGESFMIAFTRAFSDIDPRIDQFTFQTTEEIALRVRELLIPTPEPQDIDDGPVDPPTEPAPVPDIPVLEDPAEEPDSVLEPLIDEELPPEDKLEENRECYALKRSLLNRYHIFDHGAFVKRSRAHHVWQSSGEAEADGRSLCCICKRKLKQI